MNAFSYRPCNNRYNRQIQRPSSRIERASAPNISTTKFRPKYQNFKRDIAIALTLIIVLYKLSTHPMIASIGYIDPNASKPMSQQDIVAKIIKNMAVKKYKEKLEKRMRFIEVVDMKKCYDFTFKIKAAEDVIIKSNTMSSRKRAKFRLDYKGRTDGTRRNNNNRTTKTKRKKSFNRRIPVPLVEESPSSTPWAASIVSSVMLAFNPPLLERNVKGSEAVADDGVPKQRSKKKLSFPR